VSALHKVLQIASWTVARELDASKGLRNLFDPCFQISFLFPVFWKDHGGECEGSDMRQRS